ncbi:MAG: CocE/NonD family hydrolase [Anaerolineaceae bacterium]|nr:CocE/NonD family hydrolase [Anaerolineaceae bacterium]
MSEKPEYLYEDIQFGQKGSPRKPKFQGYNQHSIYIPMKDGVKLAADIVLPDNLPENERIPTLLYRTRYWRETEHRENPLQPDPTLQFFTSYGYAIIKVDVRGTGASFGSVLHEWQQQDIDDTYELVEWIISQVWSNGKVGSYGVSYPGTTAELLAATKHPAVTSIWATYFELDGYTDIAFPGGVPSGFIQAWSDMVHALDMNQYPVEDADIIGVKPVDEDIDRAMLKAAIEDHQNNNPVATLMENGIYKDGIMGDTGLTTESMMVYSHLKEIEESGAPVDIWGSWMDANTPDTVIRHFSTLKNRQRGVINAWSHGGGSFHDPFNPDETPLEIPREIQMFEIMRYLDWHFHEIETGLPEKILFYYTLGEGKWKSTTTWPPENTTIKKYYLDANHTLSDEAPGAENGADEYQIDFDVTTGKQNRWWTEMGGGPIIYSDRAKTDEKLLVYDSAPVEDDLEITGYPEVTLYVTSTETDGAFFVYLEDIDEKGKVTYITEGMLRALHRKISEEQPPYTMFGPYHSYKTRDGALMTPGEVSELRFALIPISVLIKKGHRIRIAIAGADKDTFMRVPAKGDATISVLHNKKFASSIDLPVIKV